MRIQIDRLLPVPIAIQLQGQVEYGMVNGDFPPGSRLPSVRELASELGVSPVTVSEAYRELADRGLIESVRGRGTFVLRPRPEGAEPSERHGLEAEVDRLVARAERLGLDRASVIEAVQRAVASVEAGTRALRIVFVGVYLDATRAYARNLRRHLRRDDRIVATTFERIREAGGASPLQDVDLVLTFPHRAQELASLLAAPARTATVELIPSKYTRVALAEIEPRSRVALVSDLREFLPTFHRSVAGFAGHVASLTPLVLNGPGFREALEDVDVVIYGTGSDDVLDLLPGSVHAFEYRHEPNPSHVEQHLLPLIGRLRTRDAESPKASSP